MGPTTRPRDSPGLEPGGDVPAGQDPGGESTSEVGPRRAPPESVKGPLNAIFTVIVLIAAFYPVYELLLRFTSVDDWPSTLPVDGTRPAQSRLSFWPAAPQRAINGGTA